MYHFFQNDQDNKSKIKIRCIMIHPLHTKENFWNYDDLTDTFSNNSDSSFQTIKMVLFVVGCCFVRKTY